MLLAVPVSGVLGDPALEAGLYAYTEWHPIGQAVSGLSGPVQFRVRLPYSTMPAPWAVFAVHTTDPENPWRVEGAPVTESFSPHEWIYYSPQFDTVPTRDGNWDAWCQVIYAETPGGGEPDGAIGPGDGELAAAGAAAPAAWNPPPYGWPEGFPCPDNGQNDLFCGPTGFVAKNLTVDDLDVPGLLQTRMFVGAEEPPPSPVNWTADLADGIELADNPAGVSVEFRLVPLAASTGQQDDTSVGSAPGSIGGVVPGGGTGLYYVDASAEEFLTGDSAQWLSSALAVTDVAPYFVDVTAARTGDVHASVTTTDTAGAGPLLGHCYVVTRPGDHLMLEYDGSTPSASSATTNEQVPLIWFRYAGDYAIAASYQDDKPGMHAGQHQWASPAAGTVHVPGGEFFADNAEDLAAYWLEVASYLDGLTAWIAAGVRQDSTAFGPGFYSPRYPRPGGAILEVSAAEFLSALDEDEVLYHAGHGSTAHVELHRTPDDVDLYASDIVDRFPNGGMEQARFVQIASCYSYSSDGSPSVCAAITAAGAQAVFGYNAETWPLYAAIAEKRLWDYLVLGWPANDNTARQVMAELEAAGWDPTSAGWRDKDSTPYEDEHFVLVGSAYIVPALTF